MVDVKVKCKDCVHFGEPLPIEEQAFKYKCNRQKNVVTCPDLRCSFAERKRIKFSPSGLSKFRRCRRAFGFEYVEGFRPPSSEKQNYGKSVHSHLESWLLEGKVPDASSEGATAKQGLLYLPPPGSDVIVEQEITFPWRNEFDFGGKPDLIERKDCLFTVYDHKTTSDIKYAKTKQQLMVDEQALLYSLAVMLKYNVPEVFARWIYYVASNPTNGKRKPKGCTKVDVTFYAHDPVFQAQIALIDRDFVEMYRIVSNAIPGNELPCSPESCGMFGGCEHRATGRCADLTPDELFTAAMRDRTKII